MVYCTGCGTPFEGNFCPQCGKAVTRGAAPFVRRSGQPAALPSNIASILCYAVPILGPLVFLSLPPYNQDPKVAFDARQGLHLQIAYIVWRIVLAIFPLGSWHVSVVLGQLAGWLYLVLMIFLAVRCYQGQTVVLPLVGTRASRVR